MAQSHGLSIQGLPAGCEGSETYSPQVVLLLPAINMHPMQKCMFPPLKTTRRFGYSCSSEEELGAHSHEAALCYKELGSTRKRREGRRPTDRIQTGPDPSYANGGLERHANVYKPPFLYR